MNLYNLQTPLPCCIFAADFTKRSPLHYENQRLPRFSRRYHRTRYNNRRYDHRTYRTDRPVGNHYAFYLSRLFRCIARYNSRVPR